MATRYCQFVERKPQFLCEAMRFGGSSSLLGARHLLPGLEAAVFWDGVLGGEHLSPRLAWFRNGDELDFVRVLEGIRSI